MIAVYSYENTNIFRLKPKIRNLLSITNWLKPIEISDWLKKFLYVIRLDCLFRISVVFSYKLNTPRWQFHYLWVKNPIIQEQFYCSLSLSLACSLIIFDNWTESFIPHTAPDCIVFFHTILIRGTTVLEKL